MAVGRISGPLLKSNLLRQGIDLAFETDLLYLDVNNQRIGIKTDSPAHQLDIAGTTKTTNLIADRITVDDVEIDNSIIKTQTGDLTLQGATEFDLVYIPRIEVPDVQGNVTITGNFETTGNIHAQGNITADGNIILGDENTDNVSFNADIDSDIRPNINDTYDLGKEDLRWKTVYSKTAELGDVEIFDNIIRPKNQDQDLIITAQGTGNVRIIGLEIDQEGNVDISGDRLRLGNILIDGDGNRSSISTQDSNTDLYLDSAGTGTIIANGIDLFNYEGNSFHVTINGNDSQDGESVESAFRTLKHALSQSSFGDTIYIGAGVFEEEAPLVVPQGVNIIGNGLRTTQLKPTSTTRSNDFFKVNGEVTIENLTVREIEWDNVNSTGYAFSYDTGAVINKRSAYLRHITVLNFGSSVRLGTNAADDPYGFDAADAGRGVKVDGSVIAPGSIEAAMLFDSVTLIVPNSTGLVLTEGARAEWLNSFVYFADVGITAFTGSTGKFGDGKTYLELDNTSGTIQAGDTLTYYDTDGVTVIAQDVVEDFDSGLVVIDGRSDDWELAEDRPGKNVTLQGDAQLDTGIKKFGTASFQLDGDGDFANISSQEDFGFGSDNFTVEAWIYPLSTQVSRIVDFRDGAINDNAFSLNLNSDDLQVYIDGAYRITSSSAVTLNDWNHVAYSKNGTTGTLYLNGVSVGSWTDNVDYGTTKPLVIGALFDGSTSFFNGYIDELRVSKGIARYTSNFTTPTEAFNGDSNTVLLLHFDGTDESTAVIDDGITFQDIRSSSGGTASVISRYDRKEFGAELRSIASANVYGTFGVSADGPGVRLRLSSHDFGYIGSGKKFDNNDDDVIQANEINEANGGKIFYNSTDQYGDYRIGDLFTVNQETGTVTFSTGDFEITSLTGINFSDGDSTTIIDPGQVQTGNLRLADNTLFSISGGINLSPISNNTVDILADTNVNGNLDVTGNVSIGGILNSDDITAATMTASGNVIVQGNLTVNGTTTTINSNVVEIGDSILTLNSDLEATEAPTLNGGIEINRGSEITVSLEWNETEDKWTIGTETFAAGTFEGNLTGDVTGTVSDISNHDTDDLDEGSSNLYYTDTRARNSVSAAGDLNYNQATGEFSFTERTDQEVRDLLSGQGDITYNSATGEISFNNSTGFITDPGVSSISGTADEIEVDQTIGSVTIGLPDNVIIQGNLTVKGATTIIESNTLRIGDNIIVLNQDVTGTPTQNAGIEVERGNEPNVFIRWNEAEDTWQFTDDGVTYLDIGSGGDLNLQEVTDIGNTTTNNIIIGDIELADNRVQNINTNGDLVLSAQGTGKIRIDTDSALVLPVGNDESKPQGEEGMVRYNTDVTKVEFHNGNEWQSIAAEDEAFEAALIFG